MHLALSDGMPGARHTVIPWLYEEYAQTWTIRLEIVSVPDSASVLWFGERTDVLKVTRYACEHICICAHMCIYVYIYMYMVPPQKKDLGSHMLIYN